MPSSPVSEYSRSYALPLSFVQAAGVIVLGRLKQDGFLNDILERMWTIRLAVVVRHQIADNRWQCRYCAGRSN
jgi:hypothetical protein